LTWSGPANSIASMAAVKPTRARDREIIVSPVSGATMRFDVVVKEDRSESRHEVTLSEGDAAQFSAIEPPRVVEAALIFLLDREPKEAILSSFDIGVIRRYFPDFDRAFPETIARLDR
jgi:hypothetical protein